MDNPYIHLTQEFNHGAPLDLRWLVHGWSSHLEFQEGGLRLRCDFVTRPPRVSPAALRELWEAPVQKEAPVVSLPVLAELKKTNREKDYAVIGELARKMEDPRLQALYSRSARDLLKLDEERRSLIRKNEVRLDRYVDAAARWAAEWSRVSKEMAGRPLAEAHEIMVGGAAQHLPREP
jgi:hypothetical protein